MNSKIGGLVPLIAALLLVVAFSAGDYQVAAIDAPQDVQVTVNPNIAITVPSLVTMSGNHGGNAQCLPYDLANVGNVPVNVWVRADSDTFTGVIDDPSYGTDSITFPTAGDYQIKTQLGYADILDDGSNARITDDDRLPTVKHGNNIISLDQILKIPAGTYPGVYSNSLTYVAVPGNTP